MKKVKLSRRVFSAFTLRDDQTWEQPSFRVSGPTDEHSIEQARLAANDAFAVYGLSEDPDAPECCVELLDTAARKWRTK